MEGSVDVGFSGLCPGQRSEQCPEQRSVSDCVIFPGIPWLAMHEYTGGR